MNEQKKKVVYWTGSDVLWTELRIRAIREGKGVGKLIEEIITAYLTNRGDSP